MPALTGLLDRLEKGGFVTRSRCEKDGRVGYVDLTTKAENVLHRIDGPLTDLYKECLGHLSRAELEQLASPQGSRMSAATVLVLNATGKAGRNVCRALIEAGFDVHGNTRSSTGLLESMGVKPVV